MNRRLSIPPVGRDREGLSPQAFARARQRLNDWLDPLILERHSRNPDCPRIRRRISWYCDEWFVFLDDPQLPADNNLFWARITLAPARKCRPCAPSYTACKL